MRRFVFDCAISHCIFTATGRRVKITQTILDLRGHSQPDLGVTIHDITLRGGREFADIHQWSR